jgi:hypothetical protein
LLSLADILRKSLEGQPAAGIEMRLLPLFQVLLANAVLIAILLWITGDYSYRDSYFATEGFTTTTVRYPLFLITSALKGSTTIPGLLTLDWQQVVLLLLLVTDAVYAYSVLRTRGHQA